MPKACLVQPAGRSKRVAVVAVGEIGAVQRAPVGVEATGNEDLAVNEEGGRMVNASCRQSPDRRPPTAFRVVLLRRGEKAVGVESRATHEEDVAVIEQGRGRRVEQERQLTRRGPRARFRVVELGGPQAAAGNQDLARTEQRRGMSCPGGCHVWHGLPSALGGVEHLGGREGLMVSLHCCADESYSSADEIDSWDGPFWPPATSTRPSCSNVAV